MRPGAGLDPVGDGGSRESRATTGRVVQHVGPITRDHTQEHTLAAATAGHHDAVVPAEEIDANLASDGRLETPTEVRLSDRIPLRGDRSRAQLEVAVLEAAGLDPLGDVGAEDVRLPVDVDVEAPRLFKEGVAPALQARDEPFPVLADIFGRHAPHRGFDRRVRQSGLQLLRHVIPCRPRQLGQDPLVDVPAVVGQAGQGGMPRTESHERGKLPTQQGVEQPFEAHEGLIAILRDRLPARLVRHSSPPPLIAVTIPVADELIDQARSQVGRRVGAHLRAHAQASPHLCAVDRLRGPLEIGASAPLFEVSDHVRKGRPELAEEGIVRHHEEARLVVEHAARFQQSRRHHRPRGIGGAQLVDEQATCERLAQVDRQQLLAAFQHGPERVVAAVAALEGESPSLSVPHPNRRGQAAGVGGQVQDRERDRRGVETAVTGAPEPAAQEACPVLRADGNRALGGRARLVVRPRRGRGRQGCDQGQKEGGPKGPAEHGRYLPMAGVFHHGEPPHPHRVGSMPSCWTRKASSRDSSSTIFPIGRPPACPALVS